MLEESYTAQLEHVDALAVGDFTFPECWTIFSNQELSIQAGFITEERCRPSADLNSLYIWCAVTRNESVKKQMLLPRDIRI